jgi:hypothetical protein
MYSLKDEFEILKKDIVNLYDAKGMRASGKYADALEVVVTENNAKLLGLQYTTQLEMGRKGGTFPNLGAIKQWILDKGVFSQAIQEIGINSLAYLIGRKIANEGWRREKFGGVNLISEVLTDERIQKLLNDFGANRVLTLTSEFIEYANTLQ